MIGRPQPAVRIDELRAVVAHVRALDREKSRPASRAHIWAYAAFLVILLGSIRAPAPRAYLPSSLNPIEESRMRTLQSLGVVSSIAIASAATAQNAVQWRVEDGGNGHWYADTAEVLVWPQLRTACEIRGGHLATVTSIAEWAWLKATLPVVGRFVGGFQDKSSSSYMEPGGGWRWVTDEPLVFDPTTMSPNDDCPGGVPGLCGCNAIGAQDVLFFPGCCNSRLDDIGDGIVQNCDSIARPGIIEWSADCNADGIVDYGQIRAGELVDANANNIPDCCEEGSPCDPCPADVDQSGAVNGVDLAAILNVWGTSGGKYPRADINHDGVVNGPDLAEVLSAWGTCQ